MKRFITILCTVLTGSALFAQNSVLDIREAHPGKDLTMEEAIYKGVGYSRIPRDKYPQFPAKGEGRFTVFQDEYSLFLKDNLSGEVTDIAVSNNSGIVYGQTVSRNEFGIDANPNKIDASIEELKKTDPAKAYEFQRRFEGLSNEVMNKRNAVQQQNAYYEVNKFEQEYSPILHSSPALYNIMSQYVQNYGNTGNMYGQLKNVLDTIMPAYQEAFNAGRQYALEEKAKKDTSQVSGGIATDNTQTYNGNGVVFTRDQIRKMSTDEFAKYEKEIMRQMREGKIQ